ncbi:MAG: NAD-binding protein [Bacillota bacterium]|nr:NAD-binding protein [Bacillota bacterium]
MYVLIIGGGKVGFNLAYALAHDQEEITVIERDRTALDKFKELPHVKTVQGDGTDPRLLEHTGITRAQVVVAVTGSDVDNLTVALLAKRQFGVRRVIARVNNLKNEWLFNRARGVDFAVNGARIIAQVMQEELSLGELVTLLKLEGGEISLVEEEVIPTSRAVGKRLAELNLPGDVLLAAILREGKIVIPRGETRLAAGDKVLALAYAERAHALEEILA